MRKIVFAGIVGLVFALAFAQAGSFRLSVNLGVRGIALEADRVVFGVFPGFGVVRHAQIRERSADGVAIVYRAGHRAVALAYALEFERQGWVRVSRVDGPRRTLLTYRGPERTVRVVLNDWGAQTEARAFIY